MWRGCNDDMRWPYMMTWTARLIIMGIHCMHDSARICDQHNTNVEAWWYTCKNGVDLPRNTNITIANHHSTTSHDKAQSDTRHDRADNHDIYQYLIVPRTWTNSWYDRTDICDQRWTWCLDHSKHQTMMMLLPYDAIPQLTMPIILLMPMIIHHYESPPTIEPSVEW